MRTITLKGQKLENSMLINSVRNTYWICTEVKQFPDNRFRATVMECRPVKQYADANGNRSAVAFEVFYMDDYLVGFDTKRIGVPYITLSRRKIYLDGIPCSEAALYPVR